MQYKGFIAKYFYDIRSGVFIGEIINAEEVIVFTAATISSLRLAMADAIEYHLVLKGLETTCV